ncbi:MAG TPA: hypothetical protein VN285_07230, partial [Candidatus Deferrimicrobium sp.]|nr:hypothetical protein [Candidatus Deferrimicrobium sp.]
MAAFDITQFQPTAWTSLARSFEAGKVAGTYLVYGREGTGRWALAISLAALLNCEHPTRGGPPVEVLRPCGACRACRMIFGLNFEGLHFALPIPPHKSSDEAIDLTAKALDLKRGDPFRILSGSGNMNIPISLARDIKRRLSLKADTGVTRLVLFYQMERMLAASADA